MLSPCGKPQPDGCLSRRPQAFLKGRQFMIGKAHRTQRQRSASWFYLLTALLLFASLFVVAGAQVASASQCGQVNNPPACSLAFRFENPAKSGSYTITNPHQAAANETIT